MATEWTRPATARTPVLLAEREGLSSAEVAERVSQGLTNRVPDTPARSVWDIVRANVLTPFNAIVAGGFVLLLVLGAWRDALFGLSALGNAVIGVTQEVHAKRMLARLAVVNAPRTRVLRDGGETEVPVEELVRDDAIVLRAGDQLPADGVVLEAEALEIDEAVLTGEAEPVPKGAGARVLSGSVVVAGSGLARATRVGALSFASELTVQARRFSLASSEIRAGTDRVLRWLLWALPSVALVVINGQMQALGGWDTAIRTGTWRSGAVGAVASITAMIPLGLVLMSSVVMAVGALRLGRQQVLVRELTAVEGLARVDLLCLDKTGTITEGGIAFDGLRLVSREEPPGLEEALAWFGAAADANATARSLAAAFPAGRPVASVATVPFDSARRWSAVRFGADATPAGTWVLGAPELLPAGTGGGTAALVAEAAASGLRTLVLATTPSPLDGGPAPVLPPGLRPVALLTFREVVRPEARRTLDYFREQGVRIRILSGDDPRTVAAIAREVGVECDEGVDARRLPEDQDELGELLETHAVLGRVAPEQKRRIVHALQARGHVVAMTGDGVNDVLALKDADLGIAMDSATAATKAVARVVLLDGRFDRLPGVVAEGRRVIANIERVSMLYLAKTAYAVLLSVTFGALLWSFPFLPRQLSVTDGLTIGIPSFFLALMPNAQRYRSGFLRRALAFAVPAGGVVAAAIVAVHGIARLQGLSGADAVGDASVVVLTAAGLWILVVVSRPLDLGRLLVIAAMVAASVAMFALPITAEFFALTLPPGELLLVAAGPALGAIIAIEVLARVHRRRYASR